MSRFPGRGFCLWGSCFQSFWVRVKWNVSAAAQMQSIPGVKRCDNELMVCVKVNQGFPALGLKRRRKKLSYQGRRKGGKEKAFA